jgi:hypothetical protein
MKSSPRPKARPESKLAPKKSPRPSTASDGALERALRNSQPGKMAKGGMCRGMGAAKKGGKYSKSG